VANDEEVGVRLSLKQRKQFSAEADRAAKDIDKIGAAAKRADRSSRQASTGVASLGTQVNVRRHKDPRDTADFELIRHGRAPEALANMADRHHDQRLELGGVDPHRSRHFDHRGHKARCERNRRLVHRFMLWIDAPLVVRTAVRDAHRNHIHVAVRPGMLLHPPDPPTSQEVRMIIIEPVAAVSHPSGIGGWQFGRQGHVYALDGAQHFGGWTPEQAGPTNHSGRDCVALVPTATGNGYWLVSDSGETYGYGDARWPGNYDIKAACPRGRATRRRPRRPCETGHPCPSPLPGISYAT
jgi:hypothetical protein